VISTAAGACAIQRGERSGDRSIARRRTAGRRCGWSTEFAGIMGIQGTQTRRACVIDRLIWRRFPFMFLLVDLSMVFYAAAFA
jgi:hypothetical protein